jgi:hypothetical protein
MRKVHPSLQATFIVDMPQRDGMQKALVAEEHRLACDQKEMDSTY